MATIEKRIADLELRVGMDETGLTLVIVKPVEPGTSGCDVQTLNSPDSSKTWGRTECETEAEFLSRVRAELAQVASGPVLLIANSGCSEVAA